MSKFLFHFWRNVLLNFLVITFLATAARGAEPIKALLICGGCCHGYDEQKILMTQGISARANVKWTLFEEGDDRDHMASIYENPDWAKGYDVVVHNECFGYVSNAAFIQRIVDAHVKNGIPAVMIHCSTHSYRASPNDEWRKLLGVTSFVHEKKRTFEVVNLHPENPIMKDFPMRWTDPEDELYEIKKVWPNCVPLAKGIGVTNAEYPCVWINMDGGAKVFGTTMGHDKSMHEKVYLDLVTRGLLWSVGKLGDDGKPVAGYERK